MPPNQRNRFETDKFTLCKLDKEDDFCCDEVRCFDCGDKDLNEFFREDALKYKKALLSETYYFQPREATEKDLLIPVAFISFLNDSVQITREERKTGKKGLWKYLKQAIPHPKRNYTSFPAVKIVRLAVCTSQQRKDFGTSLLNMTKSLFLTDNRTGCRFLTVDAYNT